MKILVNCTGFIGDILFASSLAQKLKDQQPCTVDYLIHLTQPHLLLKQNPYIDEVYLYECDLSVYDRVVNLHGIDFNYQPAVWYQMQAGIENPTPDFKVYTLPEYDQWAAEAISKLRDGRPVVAVMDGWMEKSYIFTAEQYRAGIDVPNLGYGGSHRNIPYILEKLDPHINLVQVGKHIGFNARLVSNGHDYTAEASVIKHCDAFIGTEGGLANLAFGVGTKTILTGDFVHQLYGWNGVLKQIKEPKLGPVWYGEGHIEISPYASDDEVIDTILDSI